MARDGGSNKVKEFIAEFLSTERVFTHTHTCVTMASSRREPPILRGTGRFRPPPTRPSVPSFTVMDPKVAWLLHWVKIAPNRKPLASSREATHLQPPAPPRLFLFTLHSLGWQSKLRIKSAVMNLEVKLHFVPAVTFLNNTKTDM